MTEDKRTPPRNVPPEEEAIQKALGTYPTRICEICGKEIYYDKCWFYTTNIDTYVIVCEECYKTCIL